jgi:hypothetical protein
MKYLKRFDESLFYGSPGIEDDDMGDQEMNDKMGPESSDDDEIMETALESDMTLELMEVIRPFYEEHGAEKTKQYLSEILNSFDDELFIQDYYNSPQ